MPAYLAFFRGINVGGNNMIAMPALKALHESLGFENVKTHLQSGNVVFTAKRTDPAQLAKKIAAKLGEIVVVVRTPDDLRTAIAKNPFPGEAKADPSHLVVIFLSEEPTATAKKAMLAVDVGSEPKQIVGRNLYVYYGANMARSKLSNKLIEKTLGVRATARNWNTVTRLLELADAVDK
jgi:uncharacterized protein (DUF1697 family)